MPSSSLNVPKYKNPYHELINIYSNQENNKINYILITAIINDL